jgi:hypothetical protein
MDDLTSSEEVSPTPKDTNNEASRSEEEDKQDELGQLIEGDRHEALGRVWDAQIIGSTCGGGKVL